MEDISSFVRYNTDTFFGGRPTEKTILHEVLAEAAATGAKVIVKTSTGTWYIKGANDRTYEDIERHLENNVANEFKPNSRTWLLRY